MSWMICQTPRKGPNEVVCFVPRQAPSLRFQALGQGEASINVRLNFIPLTTFADPVYFGVFVQKMLLIQNQVFLPKDVT